MKNDQVIKNLIGINCNILAGFWTFSGNFLTQYCASYNTLFKQASRSYSITVSTVWCSIISYINIEGSKWSHTNTKTLIQTPQILDTPLPLTDALMSKKYVLMSTSLLTMRCLLPRLFSPKILKPSWTW